MPGGATIPMDAPSDVSYCCSRTFRLTNGTETGKILAAYFKL